MSTVENNGAREETELQKLAGQIQTTDRALSILRRARDNAIRANVQDGMPIREAARQAGVSPSYAHRAAHHGRFASTVRP